MPDENNLMGWENLPAARIIQQIKDGLIDAEKLPLEPRQLVVECMLMQIVPIPKIAAFLKTSDRTIQRDKQEINERNSRKPSPDYAMQLIAEYQRKRDAVQEQLMAVSKSEETDPQSKALAAASLWNIIRDDVKLLQGMGYLPEHPFRFEGVITQNNERNVPKLKEELAEAEKSAAQVGRGNDPVVIKLVTSIKRGIAVAEANNDMDELNKLLDNSKKDTDNPSEPSGK